MIMENSLQRAISVSALGQLICGSFASARSFAAQHTLKKELDRFLDVFALTVRFKS